jgi:hypothetical protein
MEGDIYLDRLNVPQKKFNTKRAGALVGTITEVSEYLECLYDLIGLSDSSRSRIPQDVSTISPSETCTACGGTGTINDLLIFCFTDTMRSLFHTFTKISHSKGSIADVFSTCESCVMQVRRVQETLGRSIFSPVQSLVQNATESRKTLRV